MKRILWIIPVIIIIALLPAPKTELVNIATGKPVEGFSVAWPAVRFVFEPAVGLAEYVLSFSRYILQLLSWMAWLGMAIFLYGFLKKQPWRTAARRVLFAWLCILSFTLFSVLAPLPAPRLVKPAGYLAVDLHSHTNYSHDGVVSPAQSLDYHRRLGFDAFFVTEHGHTGSFERFPEDRRLRTVFPGMQVSTPERISLLVLADKPYNGDDFTHRPIKEVIARAHERGFIVLCPHWWKWGQPAWDELAAAGIDGFEIYNAGYRKLSDSMREQLYAFCMEKDLITAGTTDWHGWGRISNVWTVVRTTGTADSLFGLLRQHTGTRVLVNRRAEASGTFRYVFEPFFGGYYYFGSLGLKETAGWAFWILAVFLVGRLKTGIAWRRFFAMAFGVLFAGMAIYYLLRWIPLLPENQILGKLLAPILLVIGGGWFFFWRKASR